MAKHTETKVEQFNPSKHLRYSKETFIHDDKVVGERSRLQYRTPDWDHWFTIHTHEDMTKIYDLTNLPDWDAVVLRPGVADEIEKIKEEEDED